MLSQPCIDATLHTIALGQNVAIIPESHKALTDLMRQFMRQLPIEVIERASKLNGQEHIRFTHGPKIIFPLHDDGLRGESIGLAIIQGRRMTEEDGYHLIPALATTHGPILTQA